MLAGVGTARRIAVAVAAVVAWPAVAPAHVSGGAFILLLPTHLYVAGGASVVAASFAVIALMPPRLFARLEGLSLRLGVGRGPWRDAGSTTTSLLSLTAIVLLVTAGVFGSRDPLANPLPLFIWTVWWIGFTYLHAAFGNLWAHLNPWTGLYRLVTSAGPLRGWRARPPVVYPRWAGHWPAVAGFLGFAWFELVYPAPADPACWPVWHGLPPGPLRRRARVRGAVASRGGAVQRVLRHGLLVRAGRDARPARCRVRRVLTALSRRYRDLPIER